MIEEIQTLLNRYLAWLKDKTVLRQVGDWVEITTPYLDRHNDYLQIYARRQNGAFVLTDDGYTLEDLDQSGCRLDSAKRQSLLKITLNGFGVQLNGRNLEVHASADNFAMRKHNLLQAMLAINDMFYLAVPIVASLFYEDVVAWLDLHEVRYSPRVKFTGKSGFDHLFDFVIPKSRQKPERIVQAINRPRKEDAQRLVFSWIDTKEVRPVDSTAYAVLNDSDHVVQPAVIDALKSYDLHPILWSRRQEAIQEFVS